MTEPEKKTVDTLQNLFESNRSWAAQKVVRNPGFFSRLLAQQNPEYMWIGCSDSRVPANQITGLDPGEVFVHRNVANVVVPTDLNCLSTLQYAVDQLKVKHVLVVGHYGCGGVAAALHEQRVGLADNWIRHVRDVYDRHIRRMERVSAERQLDGLCELNTIEQVIKVAQTTGVTEAWARGQDLTLHGWVYGISDGLIHDMRMSAGGAGDMKEAYLAALEHWEQKYCG